MAKYQRNTGGNQSATNTVPAPAVAVPFYKKPDFKPKATMTGLGLAAGILLYLLAWWLVAQAGGSGWTAKLVALPLSFVFIAFVSFGAKLLTDSKEATYLWFALLTALVTLVVSGLIWDGLPKPSLGSVQPSVLTQKTFFSVQVPAHPEIAKESAHGVPAGRTIIFESAKPFYVVQTDTRKGGYWEKYFPAGQSRYQFEVAGDLWLKSHDPAGSFTVKVSY